MFNSFAIWLDPAQQNGHGAQYESKSLGIWHKCCESIWFESVKTRIQVLATWTQAHTFLLELAQESDCGTSLLLNPGVELWKNILEKKVRIYITQYERNRIGKSMVLLPEVRGWPAGFNTGRSKVPGETHKRSYAFLQISSCSTKTPSSFQAYLLPPHAHTLLPFSRRLLTHSHLILDTFTHTQLLVQQQTSAQGLRQKRLQAGSIVLLNVTHLPCPRGLQERMPAF